MAGFWIRFCCVTVYWKTRIFQIVVSGNHFVKNLFPGLDQVPSPFAVGTICCICFSQDQLLTSGNLFFTKIKITTRLKWLRHICQDQYKVNFMLYHWLHFKINFFYAQFSAFWIKSSCLEIFCKKAFLESLEKLTEKHLNGSLFLILQPKTLLKKKPRHSCYPVSFVNFWK